jgi:signal transduction histidine kinase
MFAHLRTTIIVSFCALMITGGLLTSAFVGRSLSRTLSAALEREGLVFAQMVAVQLSEPVAYRDRLAVRRLLAQARATHPDVAYAFVVSAEGVITDHSFPVDRFPKDLLPIASSHSPSTLQVEHGRVRDLPWPITEGVLGTVHIGLSTTSVEAARLTAVRGVLLATLIALGVGVGGILVLANLITRPLLGLMDAARRLGNGDTTTRAEVVGRDEIAKLAQAFNQMAGEVRQHLAEREELSAYVERILDHMVSTVIVVSEDLRVEYANRAAQEHFASISGERCSDHLRRDRPCDTCPVAEVLATNKTIERTHRAESGRTYQLAFVPMLGRDGRRSVVEKAFDVTERQELAERAQRAERLAVTGEIAAGVVHTLNNPLDGMRRALALASRDLDDKARVARMLALATEGTERIFQVTRTLLSFARTEARATPILVAPAMIIEAAVELVRLRAHERSIALRIELADTLPKIAVDPHSLEEVLVNLLMNAIDACGSGGEVVVAARASDEDTLEIETRDDGEGIAKENLSRIFEPFFTTKEVGRGTGLGLSMARRIVEVYGGEIDVRSTLGEGATFTIRLPVRRPAPTAPEPGAGGLS